MSLMNHEFFGHVVPAFRELQKDICAALSKTDIEGHFKDDIWRREAGGGGQTSVFQNGKIFEKVGVNFSLVWGSQLPEAATLERKKLIGGSWAATGVSVVIHPNNPFVPASHANVRFFMCKTASGDYSWWFGGGFDLTPFYVNESDCIFWHSTAKKILDPYGPQYYSQYKAACDSYFYLPHRKEMRGIGGVFFDNLNDPGFEKSFSITKAIGKGYLQAYLPIVRKRTKTPYGKRERSFQLFRRGRYVEFNLICDRGTLFGLQSGGRTESILMSLPPLASWAEKKSFGPDERNLEQYLSPREWL